MRQLGLFFVLFIVACGTTSHNQRLATKEAPLVQGQGYETLVGDHGAVLKLAFLADKKVKVIFQGRQSILTSLRSASGIDYRNAHYHFTQWHGESTLRRDGQVIFKQLPKRLKGKLTIGHEVRAFAPCASNEVFWIYDRSRQLNKQYAKLTAHEKPYTAVFAALNVIDKGKADDGFAEDYPSVYEVVRIVETRKLSATDCQ